VSPPPATIGLAGAAAAALAAAYLWLAHDHGTLRLLPVVVHEDGRSTLAATILYPRHLLRELPVIALYATTSIGAYAAYGPAKWAAPGRAWRAAALGAAASLIGGAWLATVHGLGGRVALGEVLQAYLRDDLPPAPGAHWRYHLLSTLAYAASAVVLAALLARGIEGRWRAPRRQEGGPWLAGSLGVYGLLAVLCGGTTAAFVDPRSLGHQAREAATHLVVTLPLSFALLLAVHRPRAGGAGPAPAGSRRVAAAAAGAAALVLLYVGVGALLAGAGRAARSGAPASSLIGAHLYEHTLDYVLVLLMVTGLTPADRRGAG
jgi:hypothetical protein